MIDCAQKGSLMRKQFLLRVVVLLGASTQLAQAQGLDGTLRGDVKDPGGAVIVGATVTVASEQTDLTRTQKTTSGGFNFPNLLVGSYTVTVEHQGFKKYVVKGIEVKANQVTEIAPQLELGSMTQTVEVTSSAELVQTTSSQLGTSWGAREASEVPLPVLSGNTLNLSMLQVGTTSQSGGVAGVGGAIGGNRPRNNSFVVDGVDNNDVSVTGPVQYIIPEAVGEFTLLTNQFSAEYGHSTAGQFIANTKSGTNEYHGEVFGFVNNRNFNSLDNLTKAAIARGDLREAPRFDWLRTGGAIGGPVIREKLFFFGVSFAKTLQGHKSRPVTMLQAINFKPILILARECVQERQTWSVGGRPTGVKVRSPLAWVVSVEKTKRMKPTDKAILGMVSKAPGRNESEPRSGLETK
jgi:hypothetical protein